MSRTTSTIANGASRTFPVSTHGAAPTVTVNGSPVSVESYTTDSVTLAGLPAKGAQVVITVVPAAEPNAAPSAALKSARAARIAAWARGPLVPAPARANSTAYLVEDSFRMADGSNVVVQTQGTTAASEPAGLTDGRPLTDGSAVVYNTGWKKSVSDVEAPTVTQIAKTAYAANGLSLFDLVPDGAAGGQALIVSSADSILVNRTGAYIAAVSHASDSNGSVGANRRSLIETLDSAPLVPVPLPGTAAILSGFVDAEFYVEDAKFAIAWHNFEVLAWVLIDDRPLFPHRVRVAAGNALLLDFGGVMGRRKITICTMGGDASTLTGVALTAQGRATSYAPDRLRDNLLVLGDGIGVASSPDISAPHTAALLKRYLGFSGLNVWSVGGGSGYIIKNGTAFNVLETLRDPANQLLLNHWKPAHVLLSAGANDQGAYPAATIADRVAECIAELRKLMPSTKLTLLDGPGGATANHFAMAQAITDKFAAIKDANMRLIRVIGTSTSDTVVWGSGTASTALAAGNASYFLGPDAAHPTPAGHRYRARRLADAINAAWDGNY